jgi:hypothetical protein
MEGVAMSTAFSSVGAEARVCVDLGGEWERWIGDQPLDRITVPSSYRPMGTVVLRRAVDLPALGPGRRAVLRFEGIAHFARLRVNGDEAGTMGPWTRHEFDVTAHVRAGANRLDVEVSDWQVPLGPSGAWEASGGIIRDVFLELRPDPYVENSRLQYELASHLGRAECVLDVFLRGTARASVRLSAELLSGTTLVAQAAREAKVEAGSATVSLKWELEAPALWAPRTPNLYTLRVRLESADGQDEYVTQTGLRDLRIEGNTFLLNGERLVLRGLARHDLWENQGHTMTAAQIEQDMRLIKATGANFVRLVHYPHDRRVVEAADRLGLFVTEESGLVWVRFDKLDRKAIETGLQNLERTVRRDWNSPSLFAVLIANESTPTAEVLREGARRVHALAPRLFVSSAHFYCKDSRFEGPKRLFDEGGLDFYASHPYCLDNEMSLYRSTALAFRGEKPLVFTEWGGRAVGQSPVLMKLSTDEIGRLVEEGLIAGHCYWCWADMPQFSRGGVGPEDGILMEGIVTEDRRTIRAGVLAALVELFQREPRPRSAPLRAPQLLPPRTVPLSRESRFTPLALQPLLDGGEQSEAWAELESLMERFWKTEGMTVGHWDETGCTFWLWDCPEPTIGAIPFRTPVRDGRTRPVVLTPGHRRVEIPLDIVADRLHVLGNVTLPDGYPTTDTLGERAASYTVLYADGERHVVPLRWGCEIARSNMIMVAARLDPTTAHGERVVVYVKYPFREVHQTRLLTLDVKPKPIARLVCELETRLPAGYVPAERGTTDEAAKFLPLSPAERVLVLFAVTAERGRV